MVAGSCPKLAMLAQPPLAYIEIWSYMGRMNGTAWTNNSGTLHYNFNSGVRAIWQDNGGSRVELESYATGHEMSNQH